MFIEVKGRIYKGTIAAFLNGVQVANDNSDGDYNSSSITLVVPKNSSYSVNTSASYTSGGGLYIKEFIVG
ncbi:MAG: hypothetical protein LBI57_08025 [Helicobacteraceae bacterium]|nr:hypothetical protein [Helicobacteraceae bacterium]